MPTLSQWFYLALLWIYSLTSPPRQSSHRAHCWGPYRCSALSSVCCSVASATPISLIVFGTPKSYMQICVSWKPTSEYTSCLQGNLQFNRYIHKFFNRCTRPIQQMHASYSTDVRELFNRCTWVQRSVKRLLYTNVVSLICDLLSHVW